MYLEGEDEAEIAEIRPSARGYLVGELGAGGSMPAPNPGPSEGARPPLVTGGGPPAPTVGGGGGARARARGAARGGGWGGRRAERGAGAGGGDEFHCTDITRHP